MEKNRGKTLYFREPSESEDARFTRPINYNFTIVDSDYAGTIKGISRARRYSIIADVAMPLLDFLRSHIQNEIFDGDLGRSPEPIIQKYLFHKAQCHISDMLDGGEISANSFIILDPQNHPETEELKQILLDHERLPDPENPDDRVVEWIPDIDEVGK